MTGKLADTVMSVRNGEQLARKYQPMVFNPSTPAQVAQRAKLKLMSQLSAVLAPAIAIPREGSVSSRNLFTKLNFPTATYASDEASVTLADVKLTKSVVGIPNVHANRGETAITVYLDSEPGYQSLNRVVYVMLAKQADKSLRYAGSMVSSAAGSSGNFSAELPLSQDEVVIYAYGVRDNTEAAHVAFGNLEAMTAESVAKLLVTRTLTESDVTVTETRATVLAAANPSTLIAPSDENRSSKKK